MLNREWNRVPRQAVWVGTFTLLVKEIRRYMRIWTQSLVPPVITTSLYFLVFGNLIGRRIGEMGGLPYAEFMVPGLVMLAVVQNSYANVASSFFGVKFARSIEELIMSPLSPSAIVFGYVIGGASRGLLVGSIVLAVSWIFTPAHVSSPLLGLLIAVMTAVIFATAGLINGMLAETFDDVGIVPTFVLTPLIYLGGIFYSVSMLPEPWHTLTYLNPLFYVINAFRFAINTSTDVPFLYSMLFLTAVLVALLAFAIFMLRRGKGIRL